MNWSWVVTQTRARGKKWYKVKNVIKWKKSRNGTEINKHKTQHKEILEIKTQEHANIECQRDKLKNYPKNQYNLFAVSFKFVLVTQS